MLLLVILALQLKEIGDVQVISSRHVFLTNIIRLLNQSLA